jgi:hypothetical protein
LAPSERIIPLELSDLKKKFHLASCPVKEGLRDEKGQVLERPSGGPYGLAEWILHSSDSSKGLKVLENRGLQNDAQVHSALKVLSCYIGAKDLDAVGFLYRRYDAKKINDVWASDFELGLELLKTWFKLSDTDLAELSKFKSFKRKSWTVQWHTARDKYLKTISMRQAKTGEDDVNVQNMDVDSTSQSGGVTSGGSRSQ